MTRDKLVGKIESSEHLNSLENLWGKLLVHGQVLLNYSSSAEFSVFVCRSVLSTIVHSGTGLQ